MFSHNIALSAVFVCIIFGNIARSSSMSKTTLYQDDHFKVVDLHMEDMNTTFRLLYLGVSHYDESLAHGYISLEQPEHLQEDIFQMILGGALLLEPEPKRILVIGLGIGVLPRTFSEILAVTAGRHNDAKRNSKMFSNLNYSKKVQK